LSSLYKFFSFPPVEEPTLSKVPLAGGEVYPPLEGGQEQLSFSPLLHPQHGIGGQEGFLEVVSKPSIRFKVKADRGIQTQEYI
jgi:hypothetical protein